jgi:hypothetical protein
MDDTWFDDTRFSPDYDAVWEVKTTITAEGWDAEFRIPFSQMRFNLTPGETAVWGFNVRRDIYRKGEFARWVPSPRGTQDSSRASAISPSTMAWRRPAASKCCPT